MREVWDTDWLGSTKTLDTHILTLRGKLGARRHHDAARHRLPLRVAVRRRLVLAITGVAAVAVVCFAIPLGTGARAHLPRRGAAAPAARHGRRDARDRHQPTAGPGRVAASRDALAVYDARRPPARRSRPGRRRRRRPRRAARRRAPPARGAGRLVVAVPLIEAERVIGAVRAERADTAAARRAADAWSLLAGGRRRADRARRPGGARPRPPARAPARPAGGRGPAAGRR